MEIPGIPDNIESKIFNENPLEKAKGLQQIVDTLDDNQLKAERSLPIILEINRGWGLTNQEIGVIGTVFGPKLDNPDENEYLGAIDGHLFGISFLEMNMGQTQDFMITVAVIQTLAVRESTNPLVITPKQKLTYHAPVRDNPLLMPIAS